jgi:hypothetical protein
MQLIAVTTCTDRKKYPVLPDLDASSLPSGSQPIVVSAWRKRVGGARAVGSANEVYCGRSFQEAVTAARAGRADFRIISGGLGLIRSDQAIPSYSLSLVRKSSEFIGTRVIGSPFDAARWWSTIQQTRETAPLAKSLRANRSALAVIAISSTYLSLVAGDLASLEDDELDRVRLVGMGIESNCPAQLRRCILPYDDRLDGPDSPIPGTRGDFSSRAMRHFIEHVLPDHRAASIELHQASVNRRLGKWRRPKLISRPSRTDDEIIRLIKKNWKAIEGKCSLGLRYLRDVEKIACEQSRFSALFHRAAKQVSS